MFYLDCNRFFSLEHAPVLGLQRFVRNKSMCIPTELAAIFVCHQFPRLVDTMYLPGSVIPMSAYIHAEVTRSIMVATFSALALYGNCLRHGNLIWNMLQKMTLRDAYGRNRVQSIQGHRKLGCKPSMRAYDDAYAKVAASIVSGTESIESQNRVACLVPATLPLNGHALRVQSRTALRHCSWASAFIASNEMVEGDVLTMNSGGSYGKPRKSVNVVNLLGNDKRLGNLVADEEFAHTWGGISEDSEKRGAVESKGNLIQKVMHMLMHVATHRLADAEIFCRIDADTLIFPDNVRAYVKFHKLSALDPWVIGRVQKWGVRYGMYPFLDGGAGICFSRAALELIANKLLDKVQENAAVLEMGRKPSTGYNSHVCGFPVGFFDDVTLSHCIAELSIIVHSSNSDPFGRFVASDSVMPCTVHRKGRNNSFSTNRLGSIKYAWGAFSKWHYDLDRFTTCEEADFALGPSSWIIPYALAYHDYKNVTVLATTYRRVYTSPGETPSLDEPLCKSPPVRSWRFRLVPQQTKS